MKKVSIKQLVVLEVIIEYIKQYGYPPTIREIADYLQQDVKTVFNKMDCLEKLGYIKVDRGKARAITVLKGLDDL